jgi:hypothetical protein
MSLYESVAKDRRSTPNPRIGQEKIRIEEDAEGKGLPVTKNRGEFIP